MSRSWGTYGAAWEKAKARVLKRDNYRCRIPGCRHRADCVHHITAWAIVRRHDDWNLISLCTGCHDFFGARPSYRDYLYELIGTPDYLRVTRFVKQEKA